MVARTLPLDLLKIWELRIYLCVFGREFRRKERNATENFFECIKNIFLQSGSWGDYLYIFMMFWLPASIGTHRDVMLMSTVSSFPPTFSIPNSVTHLKTFSDFD